VLDKKRLDYQKTLVGLSDTQRDKAMALYDIEKELVLIQRQNPAFSEDMIERIRQVKTEAVLAQEEFMRAQNTFQAGWSRAYENFAERARDSAAIGASAFQSMSSSMESSLDQFVRTGKLSFSDLINSMISDLLRMMLKAQATSLFGSVFGNFFGGGGSGIFTGSTGAVGGSIHVGARAEGGDINAGLPYLVGERGAELIVPKSSGTVIPNHSLSQMMGSQPQTVYNGTVVQNMSAIDTQSAVQFLTQNKQAVWSANQSAQRSLPMSRG
jgi:phage-related minor tail protein